MDQNTQIFYGDEDYSQDMGGGYFSPEAQGYGEGEEYSEAYEDGYENAYDQPYDEYAQEDEEYIDHDFEDDGDHEEGGRRRFRVAMNVFDSTSILIGVVVILLLTALIASMVSWLRADITHSFGLLQSGIH